MRALTALLTAVWINACAALAGPQEVPGRPLTLEDVLSISMLGDAQFSPDGDWLAYNVTPPYDQLSDYSYWLYASALSGHQLWVMRPSAEDPPVLQPGLNLAASNFLVGFSLDGRYVIALEHWRGRFRLAACRLGEDACTWFEVMPDWRDGNFVGASWNERLVWTSDTTFVLPVRDADRPGSAAYNRALTGDYLWRSWNDAWRGDTPTASEAVTTGRDRSGELAPGRLVTFDIVSGKTHRLAEGRLAGLRIAPDLNTLAAARVSERDRPPPDAALTRPDTHPLFDRRYALTLIDAASGVARTPAAPWSVDPHSITWSADGQRLAVYGWNRNQKPADGTFHILDVESLDVVAAEASGLILAPNDTRNWDDGFDWWPGPARAALLSGGVAVYARPADGGRQDWYLLRPSNSPLNLTADLGGISSSLLYSDTGSLTVMGEGGPWRIAPGLAPRSVAPEQPARWEPLRYAANIQHGWVNEFRFSAPRLRPPLVSDGVLVAGGQVAFVDYRGDTPALAMLDAGVPGAAVIAASRAAEAAILSARDGAATRLLLVRAGRPPAELARLNGHLEAVAAPATRQLSYVLSDPENRDARRRAETCLVLPPGFEEGRRYPVLVEVYPGAGPSGCRTFLDAPRPAPVSPDLWAARGFVYIRPHLPLDLARTAEGPIAGMSDLVDQALDALVAEGIADPDRIVLYGASQGGLSSLDVATRSDRFAAVISANGWADFFSHYFGALGLNRYFHLGQNGGDNRWRYDCSLPGPDNYCPFGFGETALEDPELYARSSPVARAADISAPVLLVHSDLDYFDMSQYDEMFGALDRAGKEARYVRYWGEGHGLSSPANIRDFWQRVDALLFEAGVMDETASVSSSSSPVLTTEEIAQ